MADFFTEVSRFRIWAAKYPEPRSGEWECDYESWEALYSSFREFLAARSFETWSGEETTAILFSIARDNEIELLSDCIREDYPELLLPLARASLSSSESDARWQLAEQLGHVGKPGSPEEDMLLLLAKDDHEYVRRRALGALARTGSAATEAVAIQEWSRADPNQEWARMMCLWALHRVGSPLLANYLTQAECDSREHLPKYAEKVRRGEVDP